MILILTINILQEIKGVNALRGMGVRFYFIPSPEGLGNGRCSGLWTAGIYFTRNFAQLADNDYTIYR